MQKTGSISVSVQNWMARAESQLDKAVQTKEASLSAIKDRVEKLVYGLSTTRLSTGHSFLEGAEQAKTASILLSDHAHALDMLEFVLNSVKDADVRTASLSVGRGVSAPKEEQVSGIDALRDELLGSGTSIR
jgi:hypothetical protein